MRFDARARGVGLGLIASLVVVQPVKARPVVPAPVVPAPVTPASVAPAAAGPGVGVTSAAETAYREGQALLQSAKYTEAVMKLDQAIELAPRSAPVQLRALAFGALAEMHAPSEAFLNAQAADVELRVTWPNGQLPRVRDASIAAGYRPMPTPIRKVCEPQLWPSGANCEEFGVAVARQPE